MCQVAVISVHGSPLSHFGDREAGGMQVYVRELSREMAKLGMSVDVFTRLIDPDAPLVEEFDDNARVIRLPAGPVGQIDKNAVLDHLPEFVCGIRRFIRESGREYHYLHSHYWLSGWVGKLLAQRWGVPHVTTFHTLARLKNEALAGRADPEPEYRAEIEERIIAAADGIIVSSDHERRAVTDLYGARRDQVRVVAPGIDLDFFQPTPRRVARATLGLDGQEILFSAGRMDPIKGFDTLIRGLPLLRRRNVRLLIGGGSSDDPERRRLERLTVDLGVADRVVFLGAVPQERLPLYYAAANLVVVPSHYESFGLVAAEALACGTPVVASQVGGLSTIVRDGENGLLVSWRRPESFASAVDQALGDATLLAHLRANARPSVERLSWRSTAERTIDFYRSLDVARQRELACCCHQ
jgi:D-inositol-3-phosphate glycosyltransferase